MLLSLTASELHAFRHNTAKAPIYMVPGKRDCPFCSKPEYRGQFRNGRCRECRKAQK